MSGRPSYPWKEGDALYADELNAAIAGGAFLPISGGTVDGTIVADTFMVYRDVPITTAPDATSQFFGNYYGAYTGPADILAANNHSLSGDSVDAGAAGGFYNTYLGHKFGGSGARGNRTGLFVNLELTATTGNTSGELFYVAFGTLAHAGANDGGTAGTPRGNVFGFNNINQLLAGATYYKSLCGGEIDLEVRSGASVAYKQGLKIITYGADAAHGSVSDYAYGIGRLAPSTSVGWLMGLNFCSEDGWWPIDPANGVLIGSGLLTLGGGPAKAAKYGVKFDDIAFGTAAWTSPGCTIDGNGRVTVHLDNAADDAAAATAGTGLNQLYRNGNAIQVRLA